MQKMTDARDARSALAMRSLAVSRRTRGVAIAGDECSRRRWAAMPHVTSGAEGRCAPLRPRCLAAPAGGDRTIEEELPMLRASELMTQPAVTCHVDDALDGAAKKMWDQDCGALAVVD